MLIWFDTEFIEDGRTIDLLSIGMVREDGAEYYAESKDCDITRASAWVKSNVLPHLRGIGSPRAVIARDIIEFAGREPDFWAYYADYDWVALCQLYGTMLRVPDGWPKLCLDIKQEAHRLGNPRLPLVGKDEHNALLDARWNRQAWQFLRDYAQSDERRI